MKAEIPKLINFAVSDVVWEGAPPSSWHKKMDMGGIRGCVKSVLTFKQEANLTWVGHCPNTGSVVGASKVDVIEKVCYGLMKSLTLMSGRHDSFLANVSDISKYQPRNGFENLLAYPVLPDSIDRFVATDKGVLYSGPDGDCGIFAVLNTLTTTPEEASIICKLMRGLSQRN